MKIPPHLFAGGIFLLYICPIKITEDMETMFRLVRIKDRLPNFGERVLFLDEGYKRTFMAEYLPDETIPLKKGKFIEMRDCKIAQDYLIGNFTHWLERIEQ